MLSLLRKAPISDGSMLVQDTWVHRNLQAYYVSTHSFDDQFYKLQVALWYVFIGGIIIYGYRVVGCRAPVAVYCEVRQKEGHAKENQNINQNVQYPLLFVQKQGLDLCQDEKVVHVLFLSVGECGIILFGFITIYIHIISQMYKPSKPNSPNCFSTYSRPPLF